MIGYKITIHIVLILQWGCNMYAPNGSTVTMDSSIKKFLDVL